MQRYGEFLNLWLADSRARPVSIGLNVDSNQPRRTLADYSTQDLVSHLPEVLRRSCWIAVIPGGQQR